MSEDPNLKKTALRSKASQDRLIQYLKSLDAQFDQIPGDNLEAASEPSLDYSFSEAERVEFARARETLKFLQTIRRDHEQEMQPAVIADETVYDSDRRRGTPVSSEIDQASSFPLGPGSLIGRYNIIRQIGLGGFAKVYLAFDPSLERTVALKVLRESASFSSDVTRRFEREAKAAAILSHPNIVPVFETGIVQNTHYIATGFCDGQTLQEWTNLQDRSIHHETAALIVATIADAVEHAHQRGIVHRDLKPSNILLEAQVEDDRDFNDRLPWRIMVTDFGLARLIEPTDPEETSEGTIVGTPAYMSPEQARGENKAGPTVDIYSLGVILYELLTGQVPLVGDNNIETLLMIGRDTPKAPRKFLTTIPKDLEAICLCCLEKSADRRYATAYDLAQDLRRYLSGKTVTARRVTPATYTLRWCVRNPGFSAAFLLVTVALIVATTQWLDASRSNQRAELHLQLSQEVVAEMVTRVARNPTLPSELRKTFTERAVSLQTQLLREEPENEEVALLTAQASERLFVLLFELAEFDNALSVANQTLEMLEPFEDSKPIVTARQQMLRHKATVLQTPAIGKVNEATDIAKDLVNIQSPSSREQGANFFQVGSTLLASSKPKDAIVEFEKALKIFVDLDHQTHTGNSRVDIARAYMFLALAQFNASSLDEAEINFRLALVEFKVLANSPHFAETFTQDIGRCQLQLARILKTRALDPIDAPNADLIQQARQLFMDAAQTYQKVQTLNPNRRSAYGLQLMTLELHIGMEFAIGNRDAIEPLLEQLSVVVAATPPNTAEFPIMRRIQAQAILRQVRLLVDDNLITEAAKLRQECELILNELQATHPNVKDLGSVVIECEELKTEIDSLSQS